MFEYDNYKDIFNKRADSYHSAMQTWPKARDEEFYTLLSLAELQDHHSIVDMLSGGGYLSWYIPPESELYHLESSSVFADFGRSGTPHPIVLVKEGNLPFADNSVDRFLSMAAMHHLDDKTPIYREMARVLKPGGIAVVADAHTGGNVAGFLDGTVDKFNPMGHKGIYLSDNTADEINQYGLEIKSNEVINYYWQYPTTVEMTEYCRQMFGMAQASEQDIRKGIEHYLGFQEEDGVIKMNWNLQFIKAEKACDYPHS